jgi:hypothetical protein
MHIPDLPGANKGNASVQRSEAYLIISVFQQVNNCVAGRRVVLCIEQCLGCAILCKVFSITKNRVVLVSALSAGSSFVQFTQRALRIKTKSRVMA